MRLLDQLPGERRLVPSAGGSGCYVMDRRPGERTLVAQAWSPAPSRHELDDLVSVTCAAALQADVLVVLHPPRFERGFREGCGDTMMGAIAAMRAAGRDWADAVVTGAAAGAANLLRHGLGTGARPVVEELVSQVELRPLKQPGDGPSPTRRPRTPRSSA